jgi:hypothetical protein
MRNWIDSAQDGANIVTVIKSKRLGWAGYVAGMEEIWSAFRILAGELTEERPLRRYTHRWEDNIKIDLKEIGGNTRNWIDSF